MPRRPFSRALSLLLAVGLLGALAGCSEDGRRFLGVIPIPHRFRPIVQYWESSPTDPNAAARAAATPPPIVSIEPPWVVFHAITPGQVPVDYSITRLSGVALGGASDVDKLLVASDDVGDDFKAQVPMTHFASGTYQVVVYEQGNPQPIATTTFDVEHWQADASASGVPTASDTASPSPSH